MEKVYIVYEENRYGEFEIDCVFATLDRAKILLKRKAKSWIEDEESLKTALEDIDRVTNLNLTTDGDFCVDLDVTYYLRLEAVIGAKNRIDKPRKNTKADL